MSYTLTRYLFYLYSRNSLHWQKHPNSDIALNNLTESQQHLMIIVYHIRKILHDLHYLVSHYTMNVLIGSLYSIPLVLDPVSYSPKLCWTNQVLNSIFTDCSLCVFYLPCSTIMQDEKDLKIRELSTELKYIEEHTQQLSLKVQVVNNIMRELESEEQDSSYSD